MKIHLQKILIKKKNNISYSAYVTIGNYTHKMMKMKIRKNLTMRWKIIARARAKISIDSKK